MTSVFAALFAVSLPLSSIKDAYSDTTPYRQSLDGAWSFFWAGERKLAPEGFQRTDFRPVDWTTISVPSAVESAGWGGKARGAVSLYRTTFRTPEHWSGRETFVRFERVGGTATVWVNGSEVGRIENGKAAAVDATPYLNGKDNLLCVEVERNGVEESGILGDVVLYATPPTEIEQADVQATVDAHAKTGCVALRLTLKKHPRALSVTSVKRVAWFTARLFDESRNEVAQLKPRQVELPAEGESREIACELDVKGPKLASGGKPYRYLVVMQMDADIRSEHVAFDGTELTPLSVSSTDVNAGFVQVESGSFDVAAGGRTVAACWRIRGDGAVVGEGSLEIPQIPAGGGARVKLLQPRGFKARPGVEYFYEVELLAGPESPWTPAGSRVLLKQFPFGVYSRDRAPEKPAVEKADDFAKLAISSEVVESLEKRGGQKTNAWTRPILAPVPVKAESGAGAAHMTVRWGNSKAAFASDGALLSFASGSETILSGDTGVVAAEFGRMKIQPLTADFEQLEGGEMRVVSSRRVTGDDAAGFIFRTEYGFLKGGALKVECSVERFGTGAGFPVGFEMPFASQLAHAACYGAVEDHFAYREGAAAECAASRVRWVALTDAPGNGVVVVPSRPAGKVEGGRVFRSDGDRIGLVLRPVAVQGGFFGGGKKPGFAEFSEMGL